MEPDRQNIDQLLGKLPPKMREKIDVFRVKFATVSDWFARLFGFWFISAFVLLPLSLFIGFTFLLPGTMFKLPVLWIFIWAPFVITYVIISIIPRQIKNRTKKQVSPKILAIAMVIVILVPLAFHAFQRFDDSRHLRNATSEFQVLEADPIAKNRVDATLVELDKQFTKLSSEYGPISRSEKLEIELFDSVQSLQSKTKVQQWADAYFSYNGGISVIYLPAEEVNAGGNSIFSPRPGHEMGHYVIFRIVGEQYEAQVPLWFNEGLVQYESYKGLDWSQIWERDVIGIGLWVYNINNPELLSDGKFLFQNTNYPAEHVDVFYAASLEFVRYVAEHYGGIRNILHRVANGEDFASAFQKETGKSYQLVYSEWHHAFFGN